MKKRPIDFSNLKTLRTAPCCQNCSHSFSNDDDYQENNPNAFVTGLYCLLHVTYNFEELSEKDARSLFLTGNYGVIRVCNSYRPKP